MKPSLTGILVVLAVTVSGCSRAEPTIRTVIATPQVPPALLEPCAEPVENPDRDLTSREVLRGWGQDRASLIQCRGKHNAVVAAITGN